MPIPSSDDRNMMIEIAVALRFSSTSDCTDAIATPVAIEPTKLETNFRLIAIQATGLRKRTA